MKNNYLGKWIGFILFLALFLFSFSSLAAISGDFNSDGKVDFKDLMIFALAYGSTPADGNWNEDCDLHLDSKIDFEDLMLFAMYYGESEQHAIWTVMVYMCGDNNLDDYAWYDLIQMQSVGSTDEVNIVVQLDPFTSSSCPDTYRYYVTGAEQGASYPLYPDDIVQTLLEQNMADPDVLNDFISWSMNHYPAEKYLLILWDHGAGWRGENILNRGIIIDETSGDYMTMADLVQGLEGIPDSIDILGFDACLMQMIEVAYEINTLTNVPKYMVASQAREWAYGWPYDAIFASLISNPFMDEAVLSTMIVDDFINDCGTIGTLSVLDFSSFDSSTIQAINSLANVLIASGYQGEIAIARSSTQSYSYNSGYRIKDLFDFAERIHSTVLDCQSEAQEVMDQVSNLILHEANTGGSVAFSHGLSIYLPDNAGEYDDKYNTLQFVTDTQWDEFLKF